VIEMKERDVKQSNGWQKNRCPMLRKMLFELEQRLDALEARGTLRLKIQYG